MAHMCPLNKAKLPLYHLKSSVGASTITKSSMVPYCSKARVSCTSNVPQMILPRGSKYQIIKDIGPKSHNKHGL